MYWSHPVLCDDGISWLPRRLTTASSTGRDNLRLIYKAVMLRINLCSLDEETTACEEIVPHSVGWCPIMRYLIYPEIVDHGLASRFRRAGVEDGTICQL